MANVDGQTLLMAVQAVQVQIRSLTVQIDQTDEDVDVSDLEDMLLSYTQAAEALRQAYEAEELISSNLPPYDTLAPERQT